MSREPLWRRYLRFWGPDPAGDIRDEIGFHLETKVEELIAAGMRPDEARREAEREFGPLDPVRKECYRISKRRQERASLVEYVVDRNPLCRNRHSTWFAARSIC